MPRLEHAQLYLFLSERLVTSCTRTKTTERGVARSIQAIRASEASLVFNFCYFLTCVTSRCNTQSVYSPPRRSPDRWIHFTSAEAASAALRQPRFVLVPLRLSPHFDNYPHRASFLMCKAIDGIFSTLPDARNLRETSQPTSTIDHSCNKGRLSISAHL